MKKLIEKAKEIWKKNKTYVLIGAGLLVGVIVLIFRKKK